MVKGNPLLFGLEGDVYTYTCNFLYQPNKKKGFWANARVQNSTCVNGEWVDSIFCEKSDTCSLCFQRYPSDPPRSRGVLCFDDRGCGRDGFDRKEMQIG